MLVMVIMILIMSVGDNFAAADGFTADRFCGCVAYKYLRGHFFSLFDSFLKTLTYIFLLASIRLVLRLFNAAYAFSYAQPICDGC